MDISKIKVGNTAYDVKDAVARAVMGASGENHAAGLVPDPGATAGTSKFLREDGTWQDIPDAFAKIRVNLQEYLNNALANGSGLTGIVVSVQNTTDNTPAVTQTWAGQTLVFSKLLPLKTYRVSVQTRTGYKLNYEYQDVVSPDSGDDITKTFNYEAYAFTVEITSSEDVPGTLDSNVDRSSSGVYFIATYSHGGNTITSSQLHHGNVLKVPIDVDTSTIAISESSDVNGYDKTESIDLINKKLSVSYAVPTAITGYIIIDQSTTDPTRMVIDESGNTYSQGYTTPQVITTIRQMSHCYVQQAFSNGTISIKQLKDTDGTKYADDTSAINDITTKNVFMRLPYFFTKVSTIETNKIKIEFWIDPSQTSTTTKTPNGQGWKSWGGNELIGKYLAYLPINSSSGTAMSVSGVYTNKSNGVSASIYKTQAQNNGDGFSLIKWRHFCIMAVLFYAYYGNTNSQDILGNGAAINKKSGEKNSLGMTDGTKATNGNSILFWGLENWWGKLHQFLENATTDQYTIKVKEDDGSTRSMSIVSTNTSLYPKMLRFGDYLDILPSSATTASATTGYCDETYISYSTRSTFRIAVGGYNYAQTAGIACVNGQASDDATLPSYASRLAFTGTVEIVN